LEPAEKCYKADILVIKNVKLPVFILNKLENLTSTIQNNRISLVKYLAREFENKEIEII
jgi:hypothetical protein